MTVLSYIYTNVGLTDAFDDASDVVGISAPNGTTQFGVFYVGTPNTGKKLQIAIDPGNADITIGIDDANVSSGVEESHIKLATSEGGLATATAGADITIGTEIVYGSPAAIYVEWDNSVLTGSDSSTDISISISPMVEVNI